MVRHYPIVLGLFLFAQATSALAHGTVVAFEKPNGTVDIVYSFNDRTEQEADNEAQNSCTGRNGKGVGTYSCLTIFRFHDTCLGVARRRPFDYFMHRDQTTELAKEGALRDCLVAKGFPQQCYEVTNFAVCDTTPVTLTTLNTETLSPAAYFPAALALLAALLLISSYWPAVKMTGRSKPTVAGHSANASSFENPEVPSSDLPPELGLEEAIAAETAKLSKAKSASTPPVSEFASQPEPLMQIESHPTPPEEPPAVSDPPEPTQLGPWSAPEATSLPEEPQPTLQQEPTSPPEDIPHEPVEPLQTVDPPEGMVLKIKRSTKDGLLGRVVYMIDARLDASAQIRSTIAKHRLGSRVIYESDARQKHLANVQHHLDNSHDDTSIFAPGAEQIKGFAKTFWKLGRAAVSQTRAALSLRITVDKLLAGVHIECKEIDELHEAEAALISAKENVQAYIDKLGTFDGQEQIF